MEPKELLPIIARDDLDSMVQMYQTHDFKFSKIMLLMAIDVQAYKIAELILLSGIGFLTRKTNEFPKNIQILFREYENAVRDGSIQDLTDELYFNSSEKEDFPYFNELLFNNVYNSLYDRPVEGIKNLTYSEFIDIYSNKNTSYGQIETMSVVKMHWTQSGKISINNPNYDDVIDMVTQQADSIIYVDTSIDKEFEKLFIFGGNLEKNDRYILVRHGLPAVCISHEYNNVIISNIKEYNELYRRFTTRKGDFYLDPHIQIRPKFRKNYYAMFVNLI